MKRIVSLLFALLLLLGISASCYAVDYLNPALIDEAGYLSEYEYTTLSAKLESIRQYYSVDVAIATEDVMYGDDAMSTADDYYDYGFYMDGASYGAGSDADGILLYICADSREYWITTHGYGLYAFTDNGIRYVKEQVEPLLAEDDYYGAMTAFANAAEELLQMAQDGEPYDKASGKSTAMIIAVAVLAPLLIAYLSMKSKLAKMKTAVANNYAANYVKQGSKRIDYSRDIFLYSHIDRTERPKSESSSHRSSSGRSHGGGGGSF